MKTNPIFFILLLSFSAAFSQSWQWGKRGGSSDELYENPTTGVRAEEAYSIVTDSNKNIYMLSHVGGSNLNFHFPFCTIEPNVGVITVPDDRLTKLVELCNPKSIVPATVEIVDIAGLVKGASKGEGLGNKFLANIRETDAILHVVRCFDDDNITHVDGSVDPVRDMEIINTELQLKDLETVDSRLAKTLKAAQTGGDK